jgi:hypothetical protein
MTVETSRTLWKAAAVAVFVAILVLIATRDSAFALLAFALALVGFSKRAQ